MNLPVSDHEADEIHLVVEAIRLSHGYDFRDYAKASLRRRLLHRMEMIGVDHLSDLIPRLIHDRAFFNDLLLDLSIPVTEMFRDPCFYREFREHVIPVLRTYPFFKIWHAGCATGEEAYSMAIMMHEEGLLERAQIYATDFNERSLTVAKRGIYPIGELKKHAKNYTASGGHGDLSAYWRGRYKSAKFKDVLRDRITFANHNLVTDGAFGDMQVILCRNVLIYFDPALKSRVLGLFCNSLVHRGFLCLGNKESLEFTSVAQRFERVHIPARIYRALSPVEHSASSASER